MEVQERLYPNAVIGSQPEVLESIHHQENSVAIYQRNIEWLHGEVIRAIDQDFTFKASGSIDEIASELGTFFTEKLTECDALWEDIMGLVQWFNNVVQEDNYKLLFTTVSSNMCKRFHTDINDLRLLCTYTGPGTLWISEDEDSRIEDVEMPIDESQIHQSQMGDVLILKGALHPEGNPILHRSPAIEGSGGKRLLLRLDTNNTLKF